jgi:signal transduction histidine kinase
MLMPETTEHNRKSELPLDDSKPVEGGPERGADSNLYYVSTASSQPASNRADDEHSFGGIDRHDRLEAIRATAGRLPVRINWQLKAVLPVAFVMLNGLVLFLLATLSLQDPERHVVLMVAGGGAVTVCAVLIFVLAFLIQRPMIELQEKMEQVGNGDLNVTVGFANRNDEIGDLGRNFNRMIEELRQDREEIDRLHRTQMSRAEHLATLGELATGLAHEIRNPLAGISGVIEIIGRDLPSTSPARAVVKDVRQEIAQINHIVSDLLETARPRRPQIRLGDLNTTIEHAVMLARQ